MRNQQTASPKRLEFGLGLAKVRQEANPAVGMLSCQTGLRCRAISRSEGGHVRRIDAKALSRAAGARRWDSASAANAGQHNSRFFGIQPVDFYRLL